MTTTLVATTTRPVNCITCQDPTDSTVTGRSGDAHGVMCDDCQYWSDGNIDDEQAA